MLFPIELSDIHALTENPDGTQLPFPHTPLMQFWPFGHAVQSAPQAPSLLGHAHVPSMHSGVLPPHAVQPPETPPLVHI